MKNIMLRYFTLAILVLGVASCAKDMDADQELIEDGVTLTLRSSEPQTRTMPGVDDLNENKITSLHYFFYPVDKNNPTADPTANSQPQYWGYFSNLSANGEYTLRVNFTEYMLNYEVFPRPYNACKVYIIANLPSDITINDETDKSLEKLREIVLNADFVSSVKQENFVMEGLGEATIVDRKNIIAATGTIDLHRVASKISVAIDVAESFTPEDANVGSGLTWYPEPESMTIELVNGISRAVLGATPVDPAEEDYFRTTVGIDGSAIPARKFTENSSGNWDAEPFYSYPAAWNVGDEEEPYLRIMLPWKTIINTEVDGQQRPVESFKNCYYKIILSGTEMVRNTWYDMLVSIGIFGSFDEQEETILDVTETTYYVADWTTGLEIESNIEGGRYLVVDKLNYEVYNENTFMIPITSSHPCSITVSEHSKVNLNITNDRPNSTIVDNDYDISLSADGKYIIFENTLNNNMNSTNFDFTPYTFTFTVYHTDNDTYSKEITITQYPAVFAEAEANTDYGNGGNSNGGASGQGGAANSDNGFVWVNGYQGGSANYGTDFFGSANGRSNTSADPNMYVFTITSTTGTNFIIGDPRERTITYDAGDARWRNSPAIYDNTQNRELKYYYGTLVANEKYTNANDDTGTIYANDAEAEAAEPTINMVAPKFRLASGYAVLGTSADEVQVLENLKKRCASYQEDGYPAGRWRLPTRAEFQFIMTQIELENLPQVYLENTVYWCAHGTGTPRNGIIEMDYIGYDDAGHSVRCVYDEWYWENSETYRLGTTNASGTFVPSDTFTWGDMPRDQFDLKQ